MPSAEELQIFEELRTALVAAPEDVSLLFRLGSGMARHPTTAFEAIGYLQRLLALEPHHPLANGVLALAYAQIGQRAAAERHLSRARRLGQPVDARVQTLLSSTMA
jgi:Flp pilus assembly protein TadD